MSDVSRQVSGHEADHASDQVHAAHGHVPADPNDGVVRARPPAPAALILTAVAVILTVAALVAVAVASGQGT